MKVLGILLVISFILPSASLQAQTTTPQIAQLQAMILQLQTLLSQLQSMSPVIKADCTGKPNLFIGEVSMDRDVLSGNSMGVSLPEQSLKVRVLNDGCLNKSYIGTKVKYVVTTYEAKSGSDPKTGTAEGYFTTSRTTGDIANFEVMVTGGSNYEVGKFERGYYAKIKIDSANEIKELKETDNSMTTNEWIMEYYKG